MCRSIKTLFNYQPPAAEDEIKAASLQTRSEPKQRAAERFGTS